MGGCVYTFGTLRHTIKSMSVDLFDNRKIMGLILRGKLVLLEM
jgi:hypothetical protein